MYIYKRGNVWWWECQRDGKRYRGSCETGNKVEAKKFAEKMKVVESASSREVALRIVDALFPPEERQGSIYLDAAWEEYYRTAKATGRIAISKRSIDLRRSTLARFVEWAKKKCPKAEYVEDIDGPIAAKFASDLANERTRKGTPLSEKSRRNIISELSTVWIALEKASGSVRNPWGGLVPRITEKKRKEPFSVVQEQAIFKAAKEIGKDWWLACMIARHTGLRYGDVATLLWEEVRLADGFIKRKPNKTRRHKVEVYIPLVPELKEALLAVEKCRKGDFVLPFHAEMYDVRSGTNHNLLNFREVLNAAGVEGEQYTFHSWRHTLRSRLADSGASIETAKRLLGHSSDEMSLRYDHSAHVDESLAALLAAR
jgi:integrase